MKAFLMGAAPVVLVLGVAALAAAIDGGMPDSDMPMPSGGCANVIGCHTNVSARGVVSLEATAADGNWDNPGEPGSLRVIVNIDSANSDADIAGIMLLDADLGGNIRDNGWTITADPHHNDTAFNYNRMISLAGDTQFVWDVNSPDSGGTYRLLARMHFDDGGARYNLSDTVLVSFPIGSPDQGGFISPKGSSRVASNPNPFSGTTTISYHQPSPGYAAVRVYDLSGRLVRTLAAGHHCRGTHVVVWDGRDGLGQETPEGLYICRLDTDGSVSAGKAIVLR